MVVLITNTGRVEQRLVDVPVPIGESTLADLRARLNASLVGVRLSDAPGAIEDIPETLPVEDRLTIQSLLAVLLEALFEQREERVVLGGTANLARVGTDFPHTIRPVLEALEEHVVLLKLLDEANAPSNLTVRIGHENSLEGLMTTSVVSVGYGLGEDVVARLGVLGPTRMDYPSTMGAVRAVASYVGQILAEG
jgi:heat-inducible transcriptional repressor